MFKKNLNDNWLAPSNDKTEKNSKKSLVWFWIKKLIRIGVFICKILVFFFSPYSP